MKKITNSGSKEYYDKFLFIVSNRKKVYSNSNIRINQLSHIACKYLIISFVFFITFLFWFLTSNQTIHLLIVILFSLLIILSFLNLFLIKKNINKLINSYLTTIFQLDNNCVLVKNSNIDYKLEFNDIKKVIIDEDIILFIPKELNKEFIATRGEYKDEIVKTLEQSNVVIPIVQC